MVVHLTLRKLPAWTSFPITSITSFTEAPHLSSPRMMAMLAAALAAASQEYAELLPRYLKGVHSCRVHFACGETKILQLHFELPGKILIRVYHMGEVHAALQPLPNNTSWNAFQDEAQVARELVQDHYKGQACVLRGTSLGGITRRLVTELWGLKNTGDELSSQTKTAEFSPGGPPRPRIKTVVTGLVDAHTRRPDSVYLLACGNPNFKLTSK